MLAKLAGIIYRYRWLAAAFWLLAAVVVLFVAPDLSSLSKNDQASFLTQDADSVKADKMMRELFKDKGGRSSAVIVISRSGGLTPDDLDYLKKLYEYYNANREKYCISEINSPFINKELEKELISKDRKAAILSLNLSVANYTNRTNEVILAIKKDLAAGTGDIVRPEGLEAVVTGDAAMSQEENENINKSMDLTTRITIILVLTILLLVYRSPVAPIMSLLTIGVSYLISRGIIAAMASAGYKISSFTETFLIAVLFGAGTDYCLLMISRFKEEISSGKTVKDALAAVLPSAGTAIISSAGTVMVGFLSMIFARFGLFNTTGPCIAIGMAVTLLAVLTLLPALISILGELVFWPAHPSRSKQKSSMTELLWEKVAHVVTTRPVRFIMIAIIVLLPFFMSAGLITRSYDQMKELPASTGSIKGFNMMKQSFNQGELMPIKIVLKNGTGSKDGIESKDNSNMWSPQSLRMIDEIAENLSKLDNVLKVRTATRPSGEKLTEASLSEQIKMLSEGADKLKDGFDPVVDGLNKARDGLDEISTGMVAGSEKLRELAEGMDKTAAGLEETQAGLSSLSDGTQSIADGLDQVGQSLDSLKDGLAAGKEGIGGISEALKTARSMLERLQAQNPGLALNPDYQGAYATVKNVSDNIDAIGSSLNRSIDGVSGIKAGVAASSSTLEDIKGGIDKASKALLELETVLSTMEKGQYKASSDIESVSYSISDISKGIGEAGKALLTIKSAIDAIQDASSKYSAQDSSLADIFYLPDGVLDEYPDLKKAMENYISPAGDGVVFEVVLSVPPYTGEAFDVVNQIDKAIRDTIRGTSFENSEFHIGGATSVLNDVKDVTSRDFNVVMCFVLLGIFIVLVILLKSIIAPLYLIVTIIFSYVTTMGISYLVFQVILGYDGLHWTVQFFSFCILVALGVDYNIFLMTRIKEEYVPGDVTGSVARALSRTGGVITSCGIIMAGTFGAMMASPIRPLVEIGFAATVGLLLDTFVIRCLLVPAIAVKVGELNWWPGRKVKNVPVIDEK